MTYDVFKLTEIIGTSDESIEHAIKTALSRASKSIRGIRWFHVVDTRGRVDEDGSVTYQVTLKIGFGVDGDS